MADPSQRCHPSGIDNGPIWFSFGSGPAKQNIFVLQNEIKLFLLGSQAIILPTAGCVLFKSSSRILKCSLISEMLLELASSRILKCSLIFEMLLELASSRILKCSLISEMLLELASSRILRCS